MSVLKINTDNNTEQSAEDKLNSEYITTTTRKP